jgi:hypothetical protein
MSKLSCKRDQVDCVPRFKSRLADPMLLRVMLPAQAYGPLVRGLESLPTIRSAADVCAFYVELFTPRHGAVMPSHPGSMGGKGACLE